MNTGTPRVLIRAPNWLGDNVLSLPAIDVVRRALPDAKLAVLVRDVMADLWTMTAVDHVLPFRCRGGWRGIADRWSLARALRAGNFSTVLLLPNSFDAALVPFLARIPERVGWATDGRGMLLSRRITYPAHLDETSQAQKYAYLVEQWLGRETRPNYEVRLQVPDAVMERVRAARQGFRPLVIGINPGATYGSAKCWLSERFAELALRTHKMFDAEILLFGGPGDTAVCATVAQSIQRLAGEPTPWCTNLAGKTSLLELAAWLQLCEALVTNDTGTMHVAAAAGTRVVAIFGPTDWKTTAPLGTQHALIRMPADCAPCLKRECPTDHRCMRAVTTDMVLAALAAICRQQHSGRQ